MSTFYLQSEYSFLKNTIPLPALIQAAKQYEYPFVALADEQLHAVYRFVKLSNKAGIKPVIGLKIDVVYDLYETSFFAYVKTQKGYENLLKIALKKSQEKLSYQDLLKYQEGLIFITSGEDSLVTKHLLNQNLHDAKQLLMTYKTDLKDIYVGLCLDTIDLEMKVAPYLYQLAEETELKLVPLHQTSYLTKTTKKPMRLY